MSIFDKFSFKSKEKQEPVSYTNCLNCGEELKGGYCHKCGQKAQSVTPNVKDFLVEYANHAFIWDENFLYTVKKLVTKPGFLSSEFKNGRFVKYTNPLKLNMFLLLVVITIFLMFSDTQKITGIFDNLTYNEEQFCELTMGMISDNKEYQETLETSERDTIMLRSYQHIIDKFSDILIHVDNETVVNSDTVIFYKVAVPSILLKDQIIIESQEDRYVFNNKSEHLKSKLYIDAISSLWKNFLKFISNYFPIIFLLTVPFLSFAVRLVNRKHHIPKIHSFVFTLHFTAFIELAIIFLYICYLIFPPIYCMLGGILGILALAYLTIAQRNFFEGTTYLKAGFKSLMINITYVVICYTAAIVIFVVYSMSYIIKHYDTFGVN